MKSRDKLVAIFQAINNRESDLKELNYAVLKKEKKGSRILKTKIRNLEKSTKLVTNLIQKLLQERKIFGTKFIFDEMDYLEIIKDELSKLSRILVDFNQNDRFVI